MTSRNWPRKLARDRTRRPSSEELSSPRSLERTPSQTPCLPPEGSAFDQNSSGLVKAQMTVPEQPLHHVSVTEGGQRCAATDGAVPSAGRSGAGAGSDAERPEENLLLSLLLSCSCSFYSPLWLIPGGVNYNKWLRSCPFWHSIRASLLSAETCHSQENYPFFIFSSTFHNEFKVNPLKSTNPPCRQSYSELQRCYFG